MRDSIKLQVEIEYFFRWQHPNFKEKVEVLTKNGLLCTVDRVGTLSHSGNTDALPTQIPNAARNWAGWFQDEPIAPPNSTKLESLREELKNALNRRRSSFSQAVVLSKPHHLSDEDLKTIGWIRLDPCSRCEAIDSALDYYHECQRQVDEVRAAIALLI